MNAICYDFSADVPALLDTLEAELAGDRHGFVEAGHPFGRCAALGERRRLVSAAPLSETLFLRRMGGVILIYL
jgi:hypothetical protein